jgi:Ferredoxin subunits of nitrite reductase and ring-hydroxylating dioxygenases
MGEWVKVGSAGSVPEGEVTAFGVGERQVAVANVEGDLHAFDDVCTHQQCSLAEGELDGTTIECPVTAASSTSPPVRRSAALRSIPWTCSRPRSRTAS